MGQGSTSSRSMISRPPGRGHVHGVDHDVGDAELGHLVPESNRRRSRWAAFPAARSSPPGRGPRRTFAVRAATAKHESASKSSTATRHAEAGQFGRPPRGDNAPDGPAIAKRGGAKRRAPREIRVRKDFRRLVRDLVYGLQHRFAAAPRPRRRRGVVIAHRVETVSLDEVGGVSVVGEVIGPRRRDQDLGGHLRDDRAASRSHVVIAAGVGRRDDARRAVEERGPDLIDGGMPYP